MARLEVTYLQTDVRAGDESQDGAELSVEVFNPAVWGDNEGMKSDNKDLHKKFEFRVLGHIEMSVPLSVEVWEIDPETNEHKMIFERYYGDD